MGKRPAGVVVARVCVCWEREGVSEYDSAGYVIDALPRPQLSLVHRAAGCS